MKSSGRSFSVSEWFLASVLSIFHSLLVRYIYRVVPEPYMDEEFHINQTRAYCEGNYFTWNPKITTPPALYFLSIPLFCGAERYVNSVLFPLCFVGICALRRKWNKKNHLSFGTILTSVNVLILPVLFDTSILYYTDLLSLTSVVWGFYFDRRPFVSALFFAVGVLTRQTNIVWAAMHCFLVWTRELSLKRPFISTIKIVVKHWAFAALGASFIIFVYWNKGIVLGDKSAHQPVLHFAQLLYFFGFVAFSSLPLFLWELLNKNYWSFISRRPLVVLAIGLCFILISHSFSLAHPYLLADNRHFTFYLWRKCLDRHYLSKFIFIPLYLLAAFYMFYRVSASYKFFSIILLLSLTISIVPAHLIEFRYFIVPYSIWRLSISESRILLLSLELTWSVVINVVALYLFIQRPFVWSHDPTNTIQRFMW